MKDRSSIYLVIALIALAFGFGIAAGIWSVSDRINSLNGQLLRDENENGKLIWQLDVCKRECVDQVTNCMADQQTLRYENARLGINATVAELNLHNCLVNAEIANGTWIGSIDSGHQDFLVFGDSEAECEAEMLASVPVTVYATCAPLDTLSKLRCGW
jgi:hypothetical protein